MSLKRESKAVQKAAWPWGWGRGPGGCTVMALGLFLGVFQIHTPTHWHTQATPYWELNGEWPWGLWDLGPAPASSYWYSFTTRKSSASARQNTNTCTHTGWLGRDVSSDMWIILNYFKFYRIFFSITLVHVCSHTQFYNYLCLYDKKESFLSFVAVMLPI